MHGSATKLQTARTIGISGGATGTATSFNGTSDITIPVTALDPDKLSEVIPVSKGGTGNATGNAPTATKLQTTRNIKLTGAVSGNANFDGSGNIEIKTTQANIAILTGKITIASKTEASNEIDYPAGFTRSNCVVLSAGFKTNGGTRGFAYGFTTEGFKAMSMLDEHIIELEDKIRIIYKNRTDSEHDYDYKIVLMKIS